MPKVRHSSVHTSKCHHFFFLVACLVRFPTGGMVLIYYAKTIMGECGFHLFIDERSTIVCVEFVRDIETTYDVFLYKIGYYRASSFL